MGLLIFCAPIAVAALLRLVLPHDATFGAARFFHAVATLGGGAIGALGLLGGLLIALTQPAGLGWGVMFALLIAGGGAVLFVSCAIASRVLMGRFAEHELA